MAALSKGGIGTEDFLRWDLPLARGWGYYHALRVMEGDKFRWPGMATASERYVESRLAWARRIGRSRRGLTSGGE